MYVDFELFNSYLSDFIKNEVERQPFKQITI